MTATHNAQFRSGSLYTQSARFDDGQYFLTEDDLRKVAPSVFATTAHESRSERFKPIATIDVLRMLQLEGFGVVGAQQSVARIEDRRDYTKHMLRLRKIDGVQRRVGDTIFEVLLKNANDGTAAYDLLAGLFRIRCLNSLVAMDTQMSTQRVRHSGDVTTKVIDGVFHVLSDAERALTAPEQWGQLQLEAPEQMLLAEAAHAIRFPVGEDDTQTTHVKPEQLLNVRRTGDQANDLWTVFNRVQENVLKGGLDNFGRDAQNRMRRAHTRPVKGIDQSTALNRALWTLGEKMAALKAA
jgi:hypothetical protein